MLETSPEILYSIQNIIFNYNALHYNYVMKNKNPLHITLHYTENVIHYRCATITITPGLIVKNKGVL